MRGEVCLYYKEFIQLMERTDFTQGRSQNLKEVPQNFTEVFNIDDVTANDVIQRNQHRKEKKT